DGDFGVRNQSGKSRLDLDEDAGRAAMIDGAFDDFARRIALRCAVPWIAGSHFTERKRQTLFRRVHFADPARDGGADGDVGVALLHTERKLRVMNESVDARLDLDEET